MQQSPTTQAEAIIYYIQEMDIDMIDLVLDKDRTYQNMQKAEFMEKLEDVFAVFRFNQNDKVIGYPGFCDNDICNNQCKNGYSFIGNQSKHRMDIILEVSNGNILDLFECTEFKAFNKEINMQDYSQIYLDEPKDGFVRGTESPFDIF